VPATRKGCSKKKRKTATQNKGEVTQPVQNFQEHIRKTGAEKGDLERGRNKNRTGPDEPPLALKQRSVSGSRLELKETSKGKAQPEKRGSCGMAIKNQRNEAERC